MSKMKRIVAIAAFLVLQLVAIGWLIVRYERVVSFGTEIRFKCAAYDPYDPLRGRYLQTTVRETTDNIPKSVTNADYSVRNQFVLRVEPFTNGLWRVAEAAFEPTAEGVWVKPSSSRVEHKLPYSDKRDDEDYESFNKRRDAAGFVVEAMFPGQFFVNEKLAPKAEKLMRERMRDDAVAVYRVLNGEIVITDIEIGGESILDKVR